MAQLDARTDDFIRMLLDVSGRARPSDLHGMDEVRATELLRSYAAVHPERTLAFTEGTLTVAAAPAVVPQQVTAAPAPTGAEETPPISVPQPFGDPEIPAWVYEQAPVQPSMPSPYDDSFAVSPGTPDAMPLVDSYSPGVPQEPVAPPAAQPAWSPTQSEPVAVPEASPQPWPETVEQVPPASDWQGSAESGPGDFDQRAPLTEPPAPWYWWLLAVLFAPLGGLIGWLVLRPQQPRGARTLLIVSLAVFGFWLLLSVLAVLFGVGMLTSLATILSLATSGPLSA